MANGLLGGGIPFPFLLVFLLADVGVPLAWALPFEVNWRRGVDSPAAAWEEVLPATHALVYWEVELGIGVRFGVVRGCTFFGEAAAAITLENDADADCCCGCFGLSRCWVVKSALSRSGDGG